MFLGSKLRPVRGADNLTAIYEPIGPIGLHGLLRGQLYFLLFNKCGVIRDSAWGNDFLKQEQTDR
jgi:hypothetical protein